MTTYTLKRKEAKTITFTITDDDGAAVDVSSATQTFEMKKQNSLNAESVVTIADGDFTKTQATSGIISCVLTSTHTDRVGSFIGELETVFNSTNIDKSDNIYINIEDAVTE